MHSTLVRIQNVFGFFTSVAFAVAAAIAVSVVLSPQTPSAKLELGNVQVYATHDAARYLTTDVFATASRDDLTTTAPNAKNTLT
jgi:hypothetical protein